MLTNLWTTLKALAASRKVMLAFISLLLYGTGKLGLDLSESALIPIVAPLWAAIFGIAAEDMASKAAAGKVAAAAVTPPAAVTNVGLSPASSSYALKPDGAP